MREAALRVQVGVERERRDEHLVRVGARAGARVRIKVRIRVRVRVRVWVWLRARLRVKVRVRVRVRARVKVGVTSTMEVRPSHCGGSSRPRLGRDGLTRSLEIFSAQRTLRSSERPSKRQKVPPCMG